MGKVKQLKKWIEENNPKLKTQTIKFLGLN